MFGVYFAYGLAVRGFLFRVTNVTTSPGVQLFASEIFGDYLELIFGRTMDKPAYVLSETAREAIGSV
jgi:hypothetical protein